MGSSSSVMVDICCVYGGVVTLAANWGNGVRVLLLPLLVLMCPLKVALEAGRYIIRKSRKSNTTYIFSTE